jgi:hypothetical protein
MPLLLQGRKTKMSSTTNRLVRAGCACILAGLLLASCKCGGEEGAPAAAKPAETGSPKIVAVESAFDFGKVKQGDEVTHVFKIRNEGTAELKIDKARGS